MRRQISAVALLFTSLLLVLGAFTTLFEPLVSHLPPRSDLLFHFLAHAVLVLCAAQLVPPHVPPEAVCAASVAAALLLEFAQRWFVDGRAADFPDAVAASVGSFAVFLVSKDGLRVQRPNFNALTTYLFEDEEDDDEDGHRVGSWAV